MTAKSKANKEQEAIDSIMLLMRHISSEQGIQELTDNVMARGKEIMESQLEKARDEVRKIESRLRFLEGSEEVSTEVTKEESKDSNSHIGDRPRFPIAKLSNEIEKGFLKHMLDDETFTAGDVKTYLEIEWKIPEHESNYITENGGNILSSNIRTALNRLQSSGTIRRVKPGYYIKKNEKAERKSKSNWEAAVTWDGSKTN